MINSLNLYAEAINVAKNNPTAAVVPVLRNYYLQLTTMIFYELTTKKTSPLISTLCRTNNIDLPTKNFYLESRPNVADSFIEIFMCNLRKETAELSNTCIAVQTTNLLVRGAVCILALTMMK